MAMNKRQYFTAQVEELMRDLHIMTQKSDSVSGESVDTQELCPQHLGGLGSASHSHTAEDVKEWLLMKKHAPLRMEYVEQDGEKCLRVVYDQITVVMHPCLKWIWVWYYDDMEYRLDNAYQTDCNMLAYFVAELDKRAPMWNRSQKHEQEKERVMANAAKLEKQEKQRIIFQKMNQQKSVDDYELRLKFYNVKACRIVAEKYGERWRNKDSVGDVLSACVALGLTPPVDEWVQEFDLMMEQCEQQLEKKAAKRARRIREQKKMEHLFVLKRMKIEALLNTIDLHEGLTFDISYETIGGKCSEYCDFTVRLNLYGCEGIGFNLEIPFLEVDELMGKLLAVVERVNREMPAYNAAFHKLSHKYMVGSVGSPAGFRNMRDSYFPFYVKKYNRQGCMTSGLEICDVLKRINQCFWDLWLPVLVERVSEDPEFKDIYTHVENEEAEKELIELLFTPL